MHQGIHSTLHIRQSSIQNNKYQVSHKYSCFSWCWPHCRPKHVEKRNNHTKKKCAQSWLCLQDYTGMHGQQNMKYVKLMMYLPVPLYIYISFMQHLKKLANIINAAIAEQLSPSIKF